MSESTAIALPRSPGRAGSIEECQRQLVAINGLIQEGTLASESVLAHKLMVLQTLQTLTADHPAQAAAPILTELLPLSLSEYTESQKADIYAHQCRELASTWIPELMASGWSQLVEQALAFLEESLGGSARKAACWSLAQIGLRTDAVVASLEKVVYGKDDEVGDCALSALADLGVPPDRLSDYRAEFERRLQVRVDQPLLYSIQELGNEGTLRSILRDVSRFEAADAAFPAGQRLVWALGNVLARHPEPRFHDLVARIYEAIQRDGQQTISNVFSLSSRLLPGCNSPRAVELLLAQIADAMGDEAVTRRWRLFLRLKDCYKPRQLESTRLTRAAREAIEKCLFSPDSEASNVRPFSADVKSGALDAAFRFALPNLDGSLEHILRGVFDASARAQILERFQVFVLPTLPDFLKSLVTNRANLVTTKQGDTGWFERVDATHLIANSLSWEAFEVLGNPGWLVDGEVLRPVAEAFGEVALALSAEPAGAERVCGWLFNALASRPDKAQLYALCHAIAAVAAESRLPVAFVETLVRWCLDADLEAYPRSQLIWALGFMPTEIVSGQVLGVLVELASGPDQWLCWRSLATLARSGVLAGQSTLLGDRVGLRSSSDGWTWSPANAQVGESASIIGLLYMDQRDQFLPAMTALVTQGDWQQWGSVADALDAFTARGNTLPDPISAGLIARIKNNNNPHWSDSALFDNAAKWIPEKFAQESWDRYWETWLPDAKTRLANVLGGKNARGNALRLLSRLTDDEDFAVRRAAARALGRAAPELFFARCVAQARRGVHDRTRAAERLCWVACRERGKAWAALKSDLLFDPHPFVRQAMTTAVEEDLKRQWAEQYCEQVIELTDSKSFAVLNAWRYGEALVQVGDDESLKQLVEHLRTTTLPPNVRHWKVGVAKALEKAWDEQTKKRRLPSSPFQRCTDTGIGTVRKSTEEFTWAVAYNLRCETEAADDSVERWEGTLAPITDSLPEEIFNRSIELVLESGKIIAGVLNQVLPNTFAVFTGEPSVLPSDDRPKGDGRKVSL